MTGKEIKGSLCTNSLEMVHELDKLSKVALTFLEYEFELNSTLKASS